MKRLIFAAAMMMPLATAAQPAQQSVQAQANAAALQGTQMFVALSAQITTDQERIEALQKQVSDLQAKLAATPKPATEKRTGP